MGSGRGSRPVEQCGGREELRSAGDRLHRPLLLKSLTVRPRGKRELAIGSCNNIICGERFG